MCDFFFLGGGGGGVEVHAVHLCLSLCPGVHLLCFCGYFTDFPFFFLVQRVPEVNVRWEDGKIVPLDEVDVGVAVATDGGLLVPLVRNAHRLSVAEISATTKVSEEDDWRF